MYGLLLDSRSWRRCSRRSPCSRRTLHCLAYRATVVHVVPKPMIRAPQKTLKGVIRESVTDRAENDATTMNSKWGNGPVLVTQRSRGAPR
jgi:hypothetical protein